MPDDDTPAAARPTRPLAADIGHEPTPAFRAALAALRELTNPELAYLVRDGIRRLLQERERVDVPANY